jgi:hypothetical protein
MTLSDDFNGVALGGGSEAMTPWTSDELNRIGAADELDIPSLQDDGTLRRPVTIWVVRYGDHLYVRSSAPRGSGGRRLSS